MCHSFKTFRGTGSKIAFRFGGAMIGNMHAAHTDGQPRHWYTALAPDGFAGSDTTRAAEASEGEAAPTEAASSG